MSGSINVATENASRPYMPDEVVFQREIDKVLKLGKIDDRLFFGLHLFLGMAHEGAIEIDVLASAQVEVEAGADLDNWIHLAFDIDDAVGGGIDADDAF